jgi:hypothetical protein
VNLFEYADRHPVWTLIYLLVVAMMLIVPAFARRVRL